MFQNYTLEILYQDKYIVVINKPSGLLVHKSMIDKNEIYYAMKILRDQIAQWVYPIHRLDKPTSGVLLFALDKETARKLSQAFKEHKFEKKYVAIVRGYVDEDGVIEHELSVKLDKIADKNATKTKEPQSALTYYRRLSSVEMPFSVGKYDSVRYSVVELLPKTGRKHQLRRHMKHISHHILGDTKYGRGEHNKLIRKEFNCNRLLLHAKTLEFTHPYSGKILSISAKYDDTFLTMLKLFEK